VGVLYPDDIAPLRGILRLQTLQPPGGKIPVRLGVVARRLIQRFTLPLEVSQHGIDERAGVRKPAGRNGDGFVDRRIGGRQSGVEFVQSR
jgi:hypothetical protein